MSHIWEQENTTKRARRSTRNEESSWLELPAIPRTGGTVKNRACVIVVGLLSFVAAPAFTGTTGQLGGFVYDDMRIPLSGVSVSASSPSQIGAVQTTTTGADGTVVSIVSSPSVLSLEASPVLLLKDVTFTSYLPSPS